MAAKKAPVKRKRRKRKGHYITGTYTSTKTGAACKYRSGWELKFMEYLDGEASVKTWWYEAFTIDYISNKKTGRVRRYIPDFKIEYDDGRIEVVEIKPSKRLTRPTVVKKLEAAGIWCRDHGVALRVITERELKGLGLL
jgi:hypothetical protein